jgi:adenine-specific DNA-methyltransferase
LPLADSTKRRYDKTDVETGEKYKEYHEDDGSIRKVYLSQSKGKPISTIWTDIIGFQTNNAGREHIDFSTQKPTNLIGRAINAASTTKDFVILDYFAGSGTTGHAVINLNREDNGSRKYILVEMGAYFDSVTKPRIQKAVYSKDWKDGKPMGREGVSHLFKYMTLEQYEDTLDNLGDHDTGIFGRTQGQQETLDHANRYDHQRRFYEGYMLSYMLDIESRGSHSLLNIDKIDNPFDYKLKITRNDETQTVSVDLIETFNYLLGLVVQHIDYDKSGIIVIKGINALGERTMIIWRNVTEINNHDLDKWFSRRYSAKDFEFDAIYVNGDNNIENMKLQGDMWKVRLIEAEFKRLMFSVTDV